MKSVKDKILCFTYEGKMEARNSRLLFQEINEIKDEVKTRQLNALFISLQNIKYDIENLKKFLIVLENIAKTMEVPVCLGEFTSALYEILRLETKSTHIKLFKTFGLAKLFINTKSFNKKLKVLMFDDGEDEDELDRQANMLTRFEHNIIYTKSKDDFQKRISDPQVDFAVSQTKINLTKKAKDLNKPIFSLSKDLVINLPLFVDTAAENIEIITGLKAKKVSHSISTFNKDIDKDIISTIMQFKGDMDGKFVLIFPREVALLSIEAMIGEKLNESDTEGLCDGIAEFCNIITGGAKTKLSNNNKKVLFELPRTYTSITATINSLNEHSGIWINMNLENKPFYMYIIK